MTTDVKIFAKTIEQEALDQIHALTEHPVSDGSKIRIMPDAHAGAGCTIGTTMTITDRVCPNLVGVDIGCGMLAVKLPTKNIDLAKLDKIIHTYIPAGFNIHNNPVVNPFVCAGLPSTLHCKSFNFYRAACSAGTLGGGNHFIEVSKDDSGWLWMIIHSGSRHLGLEIAKWYQQLAWQDMTKPDVPEINKIIEEYKKAGRENEISEALAKMKEERRKIKMFSNKDLAYLTGEHLQNYLDDMKTVQAYARINRETIANIILDRLHLAPFDLFHTIHNYIDVDNMILRKGAVSAQAGERLLIPMNMRDGSLLCQGKGNPDWNYSAPHGAGRLMSRSQARKSITMEAYRDSMEGIHSTCINADTLDESPFAYKDMQEIMDCIEPTCEIVDVLKPIYNFKASK